jgi:hypothetical protein
MNPVRPLVSYGVKVISIWERTRGLMPLVSLPARGPKVF